MAVGCCRRATWTRRRSCGWARGRCCCVRVRAACCRNRMRNGSGKGKHSCIFSLPLTFSLVTCRKGGGCTFGACEEDCPLLPPRLLPPTLLWNTGIQSRTGSGIERVWLHEALSPDRLPQSASAKLRTCQASVAVTTAACTCRSLRCMSCVLCALPARGSRAPCPALVSGLWTPHFGSLAPFPCWAWRWMPRQESGVWSTHSLPSPSFAA